MKDLLAPALIQQVDENTILWFKNTNQYVVVSKSLFKLIKLYIDSRSEKEFESTLQTLGFDSNMTNKIFIEISLFLDGQNKIHKEKFIKKIALIKSKRIITNIYNIEDRFIMINYGSKQMKSLIHPQIEHLVCEPNKYAYLAVFDLYHESNTLYLYKNEILAGSWESKDYHLLQGKFAMQLLCALHNNQEMDWIGTFHASTVVKNNMGAMIIGNSGKGKSTFLAQLFANNIEVLADDITPILAKDRFVYPYPGAISIKSGAFEKLSTLIPDFDKLCSHYINPYKGYVKYIGTPKSKGYLIGYPCNIIVSINYKVNAKTNLSKIPLSEALSILIPESWLEHSLKNAQYFLNWIGNVKFYELTYSDSREAIESFCDLFAE